MKQRVEQHRSVTGREQKAISILPLWIAWIVTHEARPENVSHRRRAERQAGVGRLGFLGGGGGERTGCVDAKLIEFGIDVGVFFLHWRAHLVGFLSVSVS